jgi:hypothetical protein
VGAWFFYAPRGFTHLKAILGSPEAYAFRRAPFDKRKSFGEIIWLKSFGQLLAKGVQALLFRRIHQQLRPLRCQLIGAG